MTTTDNDHHHGLGTRARSPADYFMMIQLIHALHRYNAWANARP
jgi:hypothetical protein